MTPEAETLLRALARRLQDLDTAKELLADAEKEVQELEGKLHNLFDKLYGLDKSVADRGGYEHEPGQTRTGYSSSTRPRKDFDDGQGIRLYYRSNTYAHHANKIAVGVLQRDDDNKRNGVWLSPEERVAVRRACE